MSYPNASPCPDSSSTPPSGVSSLSRRVATLLSILTLVTAVASSGAAPSELVTDRPDQTESAEVVPPGLWQLETGWLFTRDEPGVITEERHEVGGSLLRIGLVERLELRVGWEGYVDEESVTPGGRGSVNGPGDAELGAKLVLMEARARRPQVALLAGTSVPAGDDELTSDRFDPDVRLAVAHPLGEGVDLGYNLGVAWESVEAGGEVDTLSSGLYTVAAGFALTPRLGAFVEIFGEEPLSATGSHQSSLTGGFTWLLRDTLQLDLAGGAGLTDDAPDWFVGAGLSVRWPG